MRFIAWFVLAALCAAQTTSPNLPMPGAPVVTFVHLAPEVTRATVQKLPRGVGMWAASLECAEDRTVPEAWVIRRAAGEGLSPVPWVLVSGLIEKARRDGVLGVTLRVLEPLLTFGIPAVAGALAAGWDIPPVVSVAPGAAGALVKYWGGERERRTIDLQVLRAGYLGAGRPMACGETRVFFGGWRVK